MTRILAFALGVAIGTYIGIRRPCLVHVPAGGDIYAALGVPRKAWTRDDDEPIAPADPRLSDWLDHDWYTKQTSK